MDNNNKAIVDVTLRPGAPFWFVAIAYDDKVKQRDGGAPGEYVGNFDYLLQYGAHVVNANITRHMTHSSSRGLVLCSSSSSSSSSSRPSNSSSVASYVVNRAFRLATRLTANQLCSRSWAARRPTTVDYVLLTACVCVSATSWTAHNRLAI